MKKREVCKPCMPLYSWESGLGGEGGCVCEHHAYIFQTANYRLVNNDRFVFAETILSPEKRFIRDESFGNKSISLQIDHSRFRRMIRRMRRTTHAQKSAETIADMSDDDDMTNFQNFMKNVRHIHRTKATPDLRIISDDETRKCLFKITPPTRPVKTPPLSDWPTRVMAKSILLCGRYYLSNCIRVEVPREFYTRSLTPTRRRTISN